jgi:hypothetical protein
MRIPRTRPRWHDGLPFAVIVDGEHAGYFRLFRSAWLWREYLVAAQPAVREIVIRHRSEPVNIWRREEAGAVLDRT